MANKNRVKDKNDKGQHSNEQGKLIPKEIRATNFYKQNKIEINASIELVSNAEEKGSKVQLMVTQTRCIRCDRQISHSAEIAFRQKKENTN